MKRTLVTCLLTVTSVLMMETGNCKGKKKGGSQHRPKGQIEQVGDTKHRFLWTGYNSGLLAVVSKENKTDYTLPIKSCMDAWSLPDGGVICADGNMMVSRY